MISRTQFRVLLVVGLLLVAGLASAQNVTVGDDETLSIKGFINVSFFAQDQRFAFGNGTNAEFPLPPEIEIDEWILDGDVRNSRLTLAWGGPTLENEMKLNGVIEMDFHGGFNGTGAFSDEQPNPRLRLAYLDLVRGKNTWRLGQAWSPLFGNFATSYSHIGFPLGYGSAGDVGWRFPGVFFYRDMSSDGASVKTKFTAALMSGSWAGPGDNLGSGSAGEASFGPQIELRYDWTGKNWGTYVVGHWDKKDLSGQGAEAPDDSLDGTALEFGASFKTGAFSIKGNAYYGTAIGQQFGHITQFGDITGWGAWAQASYAFSKRWSGNLFYGMDDPDDDDVFAAIGDNGRTQNTMAAVSLHYDLSRYGFSMEWMTAELESGRNATKTRGNQVSINAIYKF